MILKIKYFGLIEEITACNEEDFVFFKETILELKEILFQKYPKLENTSFKIAQNNEIANVNDKITGTEIVLLPPFAGG